MKHCGQKHLTLKPAEVQKHVTHDQPPKTHSPQGPGLLFGVMKYSKTDCGGGYTYM